MMMTKQRTASVATASLLSNMTCRRHCGSARITQHGPWLQTVSQPVGEEDLFTMMAKAKGAG